MRSDLLACQHLARQHFLAIALGCVASLCTAQTSADPLATSYAGSYRRGSVDSSEQLVLLPDNTYCFAVMAGSLDLLSGGRWQAAPDNQPGIVLQEVKPTRPIFPAFVMNKPEQGAQVIFSFHGRSMAGANAPVFAVSGNDTLPKVMQRLFPIGHNGWAASYPLPAMDANKAQYFYIGHLQRDALDQPLRLKVTQYQLGNVNNVQLGFDRIQSKPLMAFSALLVKDDDENVLTLDGRKFGRKRDVSPKLAEDARKNCITPALYPDSAPASPRRDGSTLLLPKKDFYLNSDVIDAKPWFDIKVKDAE